MRRRFRRVALAATAAVIVVIAGGVTYAVADIGGGGVINGCYKSQNGQLRLIDPAWTVVTRAKRRSRGARPARRDRPARPGRRDLPGRPRRRSGLSSMVRQEHVSARAGLSRRHECTTGHTR